MDPTREELWVRELRASEQPGNGARTGDVLPDGSVLLWRPDIHRMGLANFRQWLIETVLVHGATIAVANQPRRGTGGAPGPASRM